MKYILFSSIFTSLVFGAFSQTSIKKIDIYYFQNLDTEDENFVSKLWESLSEKSKKGKKYKPEINLINFYDQEKKIRLTSWKNFKYRTTNIENKKIYNESDVIETLDSLCKKVELSATVSFNESHDIRCGELFTREKDIEKLIRQVSKKNRNNSVLLLLDNGFERCKLCKENLPELILEYSSSRELYKLTPTFKIPSKNGQTMRPVGTPSRYQLEFNLEIDIFDYYEIEILSPSFDEPLLKKILKVSPSDNSAENIQMIKAPNGNYRINIRDKFLGIECIKLQDRSSSDEIDEECDCTYECLYQKVFKIRMRGVDNLLKTKNIWSKEVDVFFQCSK
jgi:hypothetical protein